MFSSLVWIPVFPCLHLLQLIRKRGQDQQPHLTYTADVVREQTLQPYQSVDQLVKIFQDQPKAVDLILRPRLPAELKSMTLVNWYREGRQRA